MKNNFFKFFKKPSFTIAEILIAMALLSVIFLVSTQVLQQSTENREKHTQLMKLYPVMDNMVNLIILEHMGVDNVPWDNTTTFSQELAKKMRIGEDCETGSGCWTSTKDLAEQPGNEYYKFKLVDGNALAIKTHKDCDDSVAFDGTTFKDVCLDMYVDINSSDPPNKWGEDVFAFVYTKNEGFQPASKEAILIISKPQESVGKTAKDAER